MIPNLLLAAFILGLFGLSLLPRLAAFPLLAMSVQAAGGVLAVWAVALRVRERISGRPLAVEFNVVSTHWVQALVQSSVYFYWATAWPFIAGQFPLILGQWCFAYACTMLLAWTRREKAEIGFGPLPIILSTNFFLCFKDEWFYLQFLMIATGIFGKEFLRWQRDGRSTHIFNPSVLGLSLFSLVIILTGTTDITWAQENAIELGRPENIYLWIFAVGLIVQYFFHVTLVTFAAAVSLWLLNLAYTQVTGIYWFLDSGIPIAVFLGLHLLVTDPATSPRSNHGRWIFGALYGGGVFMLYALLEWAGEPRFYDKLLFIPILNLLVPSIEGLARRSRLAALSPFAWIAAQSPRRQNLLHMMLWVAAFAAMYKTDVVGPTHPGKEVAFWQLACTENRHNACRNLRAIYEGDCVAGRASACFDLAATAGAAGYESEQPELAALALAQACDLGDQEGCRRFGDELKGSGDGPLRARCAARDARSCYALGIASLAGIGATADRGAAAGHFTQACDLRLAPACGNLAEMRRFGVGISRDEQQAVALYDRACALGYAPACNRLAEIFGTGQRVAPDFVRAAELLNRSCRLGKASSCPSPWP